MDCVSYIRVSTSRQGTSGLGLEAQRAAVRDFSRRHGWKVAREFQEIESGRKNDRPVLQAALTYAKQTKSTLLIAKLDRLARNVHFISGLMDSGVEFRACDVPEANRLLLHIMAAVAEAEAKAISDRTVAALRAAKERGTALGATNPGSRNLTREAARKGAEATAERARQAYAPVLPLVREMRSEGHSMAEIAKRLNERGFRTQTGVLFRPVHVKRIIDRAKETEMCRR